MKTLGVMIGVALIVLALAGAGVGAGWNDGATQRADIAARAAMHAADVQAEADRYAADAATQRTAIWAGVLPTMLLIVIAGAVLVLVVYYRGRAHLVRTQAMLLPGGGQPVALLPPPEVARLAAARQAQPMLVDGAWMLMRDGQPVARCRQLTTGTMKGKSCST